MSESHEAEKDKTDERSASQIQRDIERRRSELTVAVDQLADRVSPKAQIQSAKAGFASVTNDASRAAVSMSDEAIAKAKALVAEVQYRANLFADDASMHAKVFAQDVRRKDPQTLALAGAVVAGVASLIAISVKK